MKNFVSLDGRIHDRVVASRSTRTTLRLKDGQILSIAGLMRNDVFKDVHKVPFFGDPRHGGLLWRRPGIRLVAGL